MAIPFLIAFCSLIFNIETLRDGSMDPEGRLYAVAGISGVLVLISIPLSVTLLAICLKKNVMTFWSYAGWLIVPWLPNAYFQVAPETSTVIGMVSWWAPYARYIRYGGLPETSVFLANGVLYVTLYLIAAWVTFPAARRGVRVGLLVGAAVAITVALLEFVGFTH